MLEDPECAGGSGGHLTTSVALRDTECTGGPSDLVFTGGSRQQHNPVCAEGPGWSVLEDPECIGGPRGPGVY